ncbi:MAG TPA: aminotransferase class V-fold PLP-dependent enzyme, partial [Beutenbergiaceae bacterium]|nr:aminotransferase class V-fold PLP-dependent enzyme [Beutenbergiaceae bacterium]
MTRIYLDHAATAPLRPEVGEEYLRVAQKLGNANAIHTFGRDVRRVVDEAREEIAFLLGANPHEVIFTSGGTEADNLAIQGGWLASRSQRPRVAISEIEHSAVKDTADWISTQFGAVVDELLITTQGTLDVEHLRNHVQVHGSDIGYQPDVRSMHLRNHVQVHGSDIGLISVMWANNETGVVQPVKEITALATPHGIPVHSDAVQAV